MDLLNLNDNSFKEQKSQNFIDPNIFDPDPKKGQNAIYKAVVRFLPYWKNTDISRYRKYVSILTNPLTKEKFFIDCPSSISGKPSVLWTIDSKLRDMDKAKMDEKVVGDIKANFYRFPAYYSLIYIHKDPQVSANEGKIMIWPFGTQINKLIQAELEPQGAGLINVPAINPYSLVEGKDMLLIVKMKTAKYKTYENCEFLKEVSSFIFKKPDGNLHKVTIEELEAMRSGEETPLSMFLQNSSPILDQYMYKEWTDETYVRVASFIKAIIPYKDFMAEVIEKCRDEKMVELLKDNKIANHSIPDSVSSSMTNVLAGNQQQVAPTAQQPVVETKAAAPQPTQPQPAIETYVPGSKAKPATAVTPVVTPTASTTINAQAAPKATSQDDEFNKLINSL